MKKLLVIKFLAFVLCAFSLTALGQSIGKVERELVGHLKNIQKWSTYGGEYNEDLLSKENKAFEEKLLKYTKNASTLKYKFAELNKSMYITTSEDGRFRV